MLSLNLRVIHAYFDSNILYFDSDIEKNFFESLFEEVHGIVFRELLFW